MRIIGAAAAAMLAFTSTADAALVSVFDPGTSSMGTAAAIIAAPSDALDDLVTNTGMQGFDEAQGVVTSVAHSIDGGGTLEAASTFELGAAGTNYTVGPGAAPFTARGLEGSPSSIIGTCGATDGYTIVSAFSICVSMRVTEPGDWIRVVTSVPVPASLPLLLLGVGGLGLARRLKRKS